MATPRPRRSAASSSAFLGQEDEDSSRDNSPISAADMALRSARKRGRASASHTPRKRASPQMSALGIETTPRAPSPSSSSAAASGTRRRRSLSQPPSASVIRQEVRKSLAAAATPMARRAGGPPSARQSLAAFQQDLRLASTPGPSSFLRTPGRGVRGRDTPGFLDTVRRNKELHQSASRRPAAVKSTPFAATHGIGGWGAGIGESPMDLLVQLAMAPGVLPEPTPRERPAPSFVRPGLRNIPRRNASLRPGEPVPGDLTRDDGEVAGDVSTSSALGNEQARQRRRQSTRSSNIFAELLQDEGTTLLTPASNATRNRPSLFSIGEPSGLRDDDGEEEDVFGSALGREGEDRSGMMNAFANALEGFNDDDSTRLSLMRAMSEPTTVGFNDVGADVDFLTGDGDAFGEERAASIRAFNEDEQDTPRSSAPRPSDTDLVDTSRLVPSDVLDKSLIYQYDESDEDIGEVGAEDPDASSSSASEDGDALTRQQVRKAQMGLLRRRVARRKRSRKSPITGKPTPMLPPTTVRRLFDAAVQPSKGSLSGGPTVAKRQTIALENGVVDAVEEATHEFLAEFTRQVSDVARQHGRSRTVTEQDAMAVIKAHGFATPREPIPTLARRYLPRELSDLLVGCLSTPMANSALAVAPGPSSPSSSGSSASYSPTKKRTAKGKGKARGRR